MDSSEIRNRKKPKEEEGRKEKQEALAQSTPEGERAERQQVSVQRRRLEEYALQTYDSLSFAKDGLITAALLALSVPVRLDALDNPPEVV